MRAWGIATILFCVGLGLGFSIPILGPRYMESYMPDFFEKPLHPLEGIVTHKQRDQDRLLMTVTTQDGTILATFKTLVAEIDLLVEEQDSITLNVKQYEPFVNDPPVLKVNKQFSQTRNSRPATNTVLPSSQEEQDLTNPQLESPPLAEDPSDAITSSPPPKN